MLRRPASTLSLTALATTALLLTACSGKPENSLAIRKKFAEIDEAVRTIELVSTEVKTLRGQVAALSSENAELRALIPGLEGTDGTSRVGLLEERLTMLEQREVTARASTTTTAAASTAPAATAATRSTNLETAQLAGSRPAATSAAGSTATTAAAAASASRPAAPAAAAPAPASRPAQPAGNVVAAQQQTRPTGAAAQPNRPNAAVARPAAGRGGWHTIQTGDTLQSISATYNIPVQRLIEENRLPQGARLARGQRLFIPAN